MIVNVTKNVRLRVESGETVIERRQVAGSGKHAGEERWTFVGAYVDVQQAALALLGRHLPLLAEAPAAILNVRALCDEIRDAQTMIVNSLGAAS